MAARLLTTLVTATALMTSHTALALGQPVPGEAPAEQVEPADNDALAAMFAADQAARTGGMNVDWSVVSVEDAERRVRTREMLDAGEVRTAQDYFHAAFIFQHGSEPNDFLLAHVLAVTAVSKGHPQAAWIAAATLDRYLQNIGRPQIYGTQYQLPQGGGEVTQGEYDRDLLSNAVRTAAGVPTLEGQEERRIRMQESFTPSSTEE